MERKKIKNIKQIWNGKKLLTKNFCSLDLEGLDLSVIPTSAWKNCIFFNTNLRETGIKFKPSMIKKTYGNYGNVLSMRNCDLSNNDFSYLKKQDLAGVIFDGSTFENSTFTTYLPCSLNDVILPNNYSDFEYNDSIGFFDVKTIKKNPSVKFSSYTIMYSIINYVRQSLKKHELSTLSIKEKETLKNECVDLLNTDKQGYALNFYNLLKNNMTLDDEINFFSGCINNIDIEDIIIDTPIQILNLFKLNGNRFKNVVINKSLEDLLRLDEYFIYGTPKNEFNNLKLPQIKYDSWRQKTHSVRRISNSQLTFLTKVYVELSRICNANCNFCRNKSFEKCNYDLNEISKTLNMIKNYLNIIVIGGGEPTLKLDDIKCLRDNFDDISRLVSWRMFTNGTNPDFIDDSYITNNFGINLSRHAVSDEENAEIFGVSPLNIMNAKQVEKLASKNFDMALNATCFKGGLDTTDKMIDYILYAQKIGCKKVLLTDLNNDLSMGSKKSYECNIQIDKNVFPNLINYLKGIGYEASDPIYATGGYVACTLKKGYNFSVTIQRYITKEELDNMWDTSIKRAFDLSIDPSGNLYENWHQQSGMVKSIGKK